MSHRIPSPELVRFLLHRWAFSHQTLGDFQSEITKFLTDDWKSFDREAIENDLRRAIEHRGSEVAVFKFAKPCVLCLFDDEQHGKSTFANLLSRQDNPVFPTDGFVASLREDWHDSEALRELANQHVPHTVDQFIRKVQGDQSLGSDFVRLFFDADRGFGCDAPISVIEGFLFHRGCPTPAIRLDQAVQKQLSQKGYKVWVATAGGFST